MKSDEDNCWYSGRDEFCKETYPGQYELCSAQYRRCVECIEDSNCPPERPYCDWDGECEECLVSVHCSGGESCLMRNGRWVCRRKDCVDYREEGDSNYCADHFSDRPICNLDKRRCVECVHPSDCKGERETCIDSECVDESKMNCKQQIEAGFTNYCEVTFPERPVCHTRLAECVECEFDRDCKDGYTCEGVRCIDKKWECEGEEDCISNDYKCVKHECVKKDCSDYDNPDAFCDERRGKGWRCLDKKCMRCIDDEDCNNTRKKCVHNRCVDKAKKDECTEPDYPSQFCLRTYGEGWVCKDGFCVRVPVAVKDCRTFVSTMDANAYCKSVNAEKPICDFNSGDCEECTLPQHCPPFWRCWNKTCRECMDDAGCSKGYKCSGIPDWKCIREICTDQRNPDAWCIEKNCFGYKCVDDVCTLVDCDFHDERCPEGFYCPEHECIWGCKDSRNCPEAKPHCSAEGSCVECFGPAHCDNGYDCIDYVCIRKEDCLKLDSLCPKNEYCNVDHCEEGCRDSRNCADVTPNCSQKTSRCEECIYDQHCEDGYDCDNFKCVWVGFDCSYDPECPENWFCSNNICTFGCNKSDANCGIETPHCSQATGRCEECYGDVHCEWWQECIGYQCVARKDNAECKPGDMKHGKRCRDGIWVDLECKGPGDCLGHEYCDDGLCKDREHGCKSNPECPSGYYCGIEEKSFRCIKQICRNHDDCPTGQGCNYMELGWQTRDNEKTRCISWRDCYCGPEQVGECPEGWTCDRGSGKCVEALCGPGRPCQDDRYKCVDGLCIPKSCDDREDPQGYCMEELGWYGRCLDDVCVILDCSFYSDPDLVCQETKGENWRCIEKRCIDLGAGAGSDPKMYCSDLLGIDEAYWDFDKRSCVVPNCDEVSDPDKLCMQLKDPSYRCRDGLCRHGREGEECGRREDCVRGLRCAEGLCVEKECIRWQDCNDRTMWCNHGVCEPLRTECKGQDDCRDDYHCDAGGQCVPNICNDHYDCGEGECCNANKECVRCELVTCRYNFDCRQGWRCNQKTNKCQRAGCVRDSECEEGYYCDLESGECKKIKEEIGCWDDGDCPRDLVCKGVRDATWEAKGWPFSVFRGKEEGICVEQKEEVIRIEGIDDEDACSYCRYMWTQVGKKGVMKLPPYHEHCRCWGTYED